ncbi:MAG TPA: FecR domain-containing protein [Chitinispirillaceae bacterium]|nr:FecR domain-containing protein [Chitinispirillaceae bacterium]
MIGIKTIAGLMIVVLFGAGVSQSIEQNAKITQLVGSVEVRSGEKVTWRSARIGMPVRQSWDIRTLLESSAEITLETGTVLKIGENTVVSLSELNKNEKQNTTQSSIKVVTGQMWANVKKISNTQSKMDFETPTAVASIRGTRLGIEVNREKTRIDVYEGLVAVRTRNSNQTISVKPNFRAEVMSSSNTITVMEFKDIKTDTTQGSVVGPSDPFVSGNGSDSGSVLDSDSTKYEKDQPYINADTMLNNDTVKADSGSSGLQRSNDENTVQIVSPVSGSIVLETPVIIRGKTTAGASLKIANKTVDVGADGAFAEILDLKPGKNTFSVNSFYNGKNVTQQFTIEYHPKLELSVQNIENNMEVTSKNIKLDISVSENAKFSVNGKEGEVNLTLVQGKNTIIVEAWDQWNTRTVQQFIVVYKPTDKFTLNIISPLNGQKTNEPYIQVTGSTSAGAKVYVNKIIIQAGRDGFFSSRIPIANEPQTYVMEIRAESGGEEIIEERSVVYQPEKQKLVLDVTSPQNNQTVDRKILKVTGKTNPQSQVIVNDISAPVMTSGTFTYEILLQEKDIGEFPIEIITRNEDQEISKTVNVTVNGKSNQINTSVPQCIVQAKGQQAVRMPTINIQALDRTPEDNLTIEIKNNGITELITTESGKNEQYSLLEGKNQYSIFVRDMADNVSNSVSGVLYYLPGPLTISFIEPSENPMYAQGVPPMPGSNFIKEKFKPVHVVIEIEDEIGNIPETIKYVKMIGNGQTVLLRNNNDYIYKGDVPVVRGNNSYTAFVEDLAGNTISSRLDITIE